MFFGPIKKLACFPLQEDFMSPSMTSPTLTMRWVATVLLWLKSMDLLRRKTRRDGDQ